MEPNKNLSRREVLKLLVAGGLALGLADSIKELANAKPLTSYARVLEPAIKVFREPSVSSPVVKVFSKDSVLSITETIDSDQTGAGGWYKLAAVGYVRAELIQPVYFNFQDPVDGISRLGTLAEVSVPYVEARYQPSLRNQVLYRYYFSSTHWVNKLIYDSSGIAWYRVKDDKYPDFERWVLASCLRIIPPEELSPISPEVPTQEKLLRVNLAEQQVTAFEFGDPVYSALISSGDQTANPKYQTPTGSFLVGLKRPSQHMLPWDQTFGDYDLPGVPWVCYFTNRAHAFHGAFWHNGFGTPQSHGCVNLKPEDARWIYRWTTPPIEAHDDMQYSETGGTRVQVV